MKSRHTLPIPFGWYGVAFTSELQAGGVKPLKYFDQDLVLFRTEDGVAHVLEAFCPHLGAHLGYGGV
ncbi:MAG: Rieske 2Fe-2S domain-containing protein, partial [Pseudomonadales bacterium]